MTPKFTKKDSSNSNKELLSTVTLKRFNCQSSLKATVSLYRKHWKWCPVTTKNKFCLEQFKISSADPSWFKIDTSNQWYLTALHKFPNLRPKSTDLSFLLAIWLPQVILKRKQSHSHDINHTLHLFFKPSGFQKHCTKVRFQRSAEEISRIWFFSKIIFLGNLDI